MGTQEHTPTGGDWIYDEIDEQIGVDIDVHGDKIFMPICTMHETDLYHTPEAAYEMEANKQLFLASRDLLKALRPFASLLEDPLDKIGGGTLIRPEITVQMVKDAKIALAKVAGK